MASISTDKNNGRRMLQFVDAGGKRRSIRLGKLTKRDADAIRLRVEKLLSAKISGHAVDNETAKWLSSLEPALRSKLAAAGLVAAGEGTTLKSLIDKYFAKRTDVKSATLTVWGHTRRNLLEFFGEDKGNQSHHTG